MEELHFNADITGERIDKFLDGRIESLSRSYIQKLIKEKKILYNSTSYFISVFKDFYGMTPLHYVSQHRERTVA